ncbi:MAG TPA: hydantoinase/oxoprolinase family protein [Terriglobia bacterium]|nr:hydantoinase/oxoprolinase family protein [Terriglobia bacterium]
MRIGVDTGGTFTDCVVLAGGQVKILKVFSTPADASTAIVQGVLQLAGDQIPAALRTNKDQQPRGKRAALSALDVIHGTTVGTNSLLERRGARVALITTAGFEDLLEIGRQARPRLYDLNVQREPPLAPRALRFGVKERIAADGQILLPISDAEIRRLLRRVKNSGADSLAVCFLFAFANPAHERQVAAALKSLGLPLSVSHQILPEFREFERLSTVVINAYLAPRMGTYLHNLEHRLRAVRVRHGVPPPHGRIYVMQSNGGISTAARAGQQPVRTILSGPAGGVVASAWLAQQLGLKRAISFDMGGTSTDVCLLDGPPRTTHETSLAGLPVAVPVLDVHSVGAGGGSLVRIDAGGALRVGPESAGASPGPICYGRGGAGLTVTDANLVLGRLDSEHFLGGTFRLDAQAAERGFEEFLAGPARHAGFTSAPALAAGIVAVSNATMEKALRVISVERGYDPRDFSLICYGGAGGLHAAGLARSLGLPAVIIPPNPGAFSALGILLSDVVRDVSQSVLLLVPAGGQSLIRDLVYQIDRHFARLQLMALSELRREGFDADRARLSHRLDLRYQGQSYELSVPFTAGFRQNFHLEHAKAYGYAYPERPLEIVNLRLRLVIPTPKSRWRARKSGPPRQAQEALLKTKPVWFGSKPHSTGIYERRRLAPGAVLRGPAVIVEYSATTVVPPDFACEVDQHMNLVIHHDAR